MARYLWKVSYTVEGAKGLLAEGGTSRKNTIQKLIKSVGGKLVSFDFAFGDDDGYLIAEVPDRQMLPRSASRWQPQAARVCRRSSCYSAGRHGQGGEEERRVSPARCVAVRAAVGAAYTQPPTAGRLPDGRPRSARRQSAAG